MVPGLKPQSSGLKPQASGLRPQASGLKPPVNNNVAKPFHISTMIKNNIFQDSPVVSDSMRSQAGPQWATHGARPQASGLRPMASGLRPQANNNVAKPFHINTMIKHNIFQDSPVVSDSMRSQAGPQWAIHGARPRASGLRPQASSLRPPANNNVAKPFHINTMIKNNIFQDSPVVSDSMRSQAGPQWATHGARPQASGLRPQASGLRPMAYGLRPIIM